LEHNQSQQAGVEWKGVAVRHGVVEKGGLEGDQKARDHTGAFVAPDAPGQNTDRDGGSQAEQRLGDLYAGSRVARQEEQQGQDGGPQRRSVGGVNEPQALVGMTPAAPEVDRDQVVFPPPGVAGDAQNHSHYQPRSQGRQREHEDRARR